MPGAVLADEVPASPAVVPPAPAASGYPAAEADPPAAVVTPATIAAWNDDVSDVDKLRTPSSPAFVILGVSPTEIQHPTTPTDVAIALGGLVRGGDLTVPQNAAIEIAPYWLVPHRKLTFEGYRDEKLLRPLRTLSLSIATVQSQRTDSSNPAAPVMHTDADIGLGFRTMLLQWGAEDACTASIKKNTAIISQGMVFTDAEMREAAGAGNLGSETRDKQIAEINARKKAALEAAISNRKQLQSSKDICGPLAASTTGFSLDLAGALDLRALDSKLTQADTSLAGYGLWTTLSYDASDFSAIAVARIRSQQDAGTMTTGKLLDGGLRGIFKRNTYALSAEGLIRRDLSNGAHATTYKVDLGVEYKMTDVTWLSITFGKGFAFASGDAASWFSLANLQWSFGKPSF
ncbi:MAG TPA: hypothetical protein VHW23_48170 [Kofleriaceae bacterium]|nr:hypothetical protein [Kofleriaceae bacterium]